MYLGELYLLVVLINYSSIEKLDDLHFKISNKDLDKCVNV